MVEQKYYTPAPEDIRVGFECEVQVDFDAWEHAKVSAESKVFELAMVLINMNGIRVPYLTAEQIEAEGWTKCESLSDVVRYKKPFYSLSHSASTNHINVTQYAEEDGEAFDLFSGKCRCINDLKLICKLLGI